MTTAAAGLSAEPILTTSSPTLEVWAMEPTILRARMDTLARVQEMVLAGQAHAANLEAARFEPAPLSYQRRGGEGVIEVRGDLLKVRPWYYGLMGWEATQYSELAAALRAAAADDEVEAIRLVIDSPGGQVAGVDQALEALAEVSRQKPLNATIEDSATSAAYWLACLAGTIEANPRALVGSIGVYTVFYDLSAAAQEAGVQVHVIRSGEHKGMGIPGAAITKKQIEAVQQVVDATAADFKDQVATGRELSDEQVEQVATGQYWIAPQALELGLIDAISGPGRDNDKPRKMKGQTMSEETQIDAEAIRTEAAATTADAERQRLQSLQDAFPGEPDFVLEQFSAGADLAGAKAAWADVLADRLEAAEQENAGLKASLEAAQADHQATPTTEGSEDGADPLANADADAGGTDDFMAVARERATSRKISMAEAMGQVAREVPELHAAFVAKSRPIDAGRRDRRVE